MELNLPYVLVEACQKRWSSEKMNLGQDGTKTEQTRRNHLDSRRLSKQNKMLLPRFRQFKDLSNCSSRRSTPLSMRLYA